MATLTLPSPYPYTDGDLLDASDYSNLFRAFDVPTVSFRIMSGELDHNNMASGLGVTADQTQRGAFVNAWRSSGTANLDYFGAQMGEYLTSTAFDATDVPFKQAIPGGCRRFYLNDVSDVLLLWTVMWGNDSQGSTIKSRVFLEVDGAYETDQMREIGISCATAEPAEQEGAARNRVWSGSALIQDAAAGWHDAGLYVISQGGQMQTRIWARHIIAVAFNNV